MTDNVLDDNTPNTPDPASNADPHSDLLATIKREDGTPKYDSVEKAIEALSVSQAHIAKLESENETLRVTADKVDSLHELVRKMQAPTPDPVTPAAEPTSTQPTMTKDQIAEIARHENAVYAAKVASQAKRDEFNRAVVEQYGDKAQEEFNAKLREKGISKDIVLAMVDENPQTAISFLGLNTSSNPSVAPVSTVAAHPSAPVDLNAVPVRAEGESDKDFFRRLADHYKG